MTYKAEKWTEVFSAGTWRELWAVVNLAGFPVALGNQPAMIEYAGKLNQGVQS